MQTKNVGTLTGNGEVNLLFQGFTASTLGGQETSKEGNLRAGLLVVPGSVAKRALQKML